MREGTKENEREGNRMRKVEIERERERRTVEGGRCENCVIREGGKREKQNERYWGRERERERERETERDTLAWPCDLLLECHTRPTKRD